MTIKLSLQEAQDLYQKSNTTRREKEPQGRHAKGEGHTGGRARIWAGRGEGCPGVPGGFK